MKSRRTQLDDKVAALTQPKRPLIPAPLPRKSAWGVPTPTPTHNQSSSAVTKCPNCEFFISELEIVKVQNRKLSTRLDDLVAKLDVFLKGPAHRSRSLSKRSFKQSTNPGSPPGHPDNKRKSSIATVASQEPSAPVADQDDMETSTPNSQ